MPTANCYLLKYRRSLMQPQNVQSNVRPAEVPLPPATSTTKPDPSPGSPPTGADGAQLLQQITQFIGRYLHCSEHQRTVLALWVFHTHCFPAAQVTPYLAIRSNHKQSGKTLCLQLLSRLCSEPAFSAGFTAATLTRRIDPAIPTLLLDEFQATIGTRSRSKNPTLRALLVSGFTCGPGYTGRQGESTLFCPKAFAGIGALPEMLADRSIPIILEPITRFDKVKRLNLNRALDEAEPIVDALFAWSEKNFAALNQADSLAPEQFPPGLSPRRLDMIEPLLQIAAQIGGPWPAKAREALAALFEQELAHDRRDRIKLLSDLRDAFAHHGNPERISTAALLDWLHTQPDRPWNREGPITAQTLAFLLQPFNICSRTQRVGKASPARGYILQDFVAKWARLLTPAPDGSPVKRPPFPAGTLPPLSEKASKNAPCSNVAARPNNFQGKTMLQSGLERGDINNDAPCSNVAAGRAAQPAPFTGGVSAANIRTACGQDEAGLRAESAAVRPDSSQGKTMPQSGLERSDKNEDQEEHDRLMAWLRAQQSSLPKCAEGYTRLAPTPRKR